MPIPSTVALVASALLASLVGTILVGCASQSAGADAEGRRLASEARSTAIAARADLTPATERFATAQAASDAAEEALADARAKSQRLFTIFERGNVMCGVHPDKNGLSIRDAEGVYSGFFIDLCRAVSTAVFGTPWQARYVDVPVGLEGDALIAAEIDLLAAAFDWTSSRDAALGNATQSIYFGGSSLIVNRDSEFESLSDIRGATVCTVQDSRAEINLIEWGYGQGFVIDVMQFANLTDAVSAYELGFCSALTDTVAELAALHQTLEKPGRHRILGDEFNEVEASIAVPHGSDQWFDLVKFVVSGLVHAERLEVSSDNVMDVGTSQSIAVRRLGGYEGDFGQDALSIDRRVLQRVIGAVGNYGEIYDRHFGEDALNIDRGRNRLWTDGGSVYAPPLR